MPAALLDGEYITRWQVLILTVVMLVKYNCISPNKTRNIKKKTAKNTNLQSNTLVPLLSLPNVEKYEYRSGVLIGGLESTSKIQVISLARTRINHRSQIVFSGCSWTSRSDLTGKVISVYKVHLYLLSNFVLGCVLLSDFSKRRN